MVSSFPSMLNDFCRGCRRAAAKYINRYAALFSFIWKFRKLKDSGLHGKVRQLAGKSSFAIRAVVVHACRLATPSGQ